MLEKNAWLTSDLIGIFEGIDLAFGPMTAETLRYRAALAMALGIGYELPAPWTVTVPETQALDAGRGNGAGGGSWGEIRRKMENV